MIKLKKSYITFVFVFILSFILIDVSSGLAQPVSKVQETLAEISDEEKAVLVDLFILSQEIDEMNIEEAEIGREVELLQEKISELEETIKKRQENYNSRLKILEQVLVSYQRRGPATFLETLLSADNLTDFLRSINTIRDLSHNTRELLNTLKDENNKLSSEKENLKTEFTLLENKKAELDKALAKKIELKQEQEAYLNSLKEGKELYEERLGDLNQLWGEIKVLFSNISKEFPRIIQEGNLSLQDFNLSYSFTSIKGSIYEEKINEIVQKDSKLPMMVSDFSPGKVKIEFPEQHLILLGTFSIEDKSSIRFEVNEGTFYEMPLEAASIEELFRNGYLLINFKELIGEITLQSVEIMDGYIEFKVNPFF